MAGVEDAQAIQAVIAKFKGGDLVGAGKDCENFFSTVTDPARQAPLRFWMGAIAQRSGLLTAAVEQFEIALLANRRDPMWLLQTGLAHFQLKALERAEYLYREALRLQPHYPLAHYNLGVLLQEKRDWAAAKRAFEAAITQQPQFAEALVNLGNTLVELAALEPAGECYRRALTINPRLANAHYGLGLHQVRSSQRALAKESFATAVECDPAHLDAWLELAECHHLSGDDARAVTCAEQVLARDVNHEIARFKRAHFNGEQPANTPPELLTRLYAAMANTFDEHLTERLGYRIPALLVDELRPCLSECKARNGSWPSVLDLGCGTGLFGQAVREFASTLVGVDLSAPMLDKARARMIYDELVECDIHTFLQRDNRRADLITATDVLIYIGKLDALFAQIPSHLNPAGIFAFSTESPGDLADDFRLESTGRYSHHARYIDRLAAANGLEIIKRIDTVIRNEMAVPLSGNVFIMRKS